MNHWEKDIYHWRMGYDDDDIAVLTALNGIIRGIYTLEAFGGIESICSSMNVMSEYERLAKGLFNEFDMVDFVAKCEALRVLLIGGKINYDFLGDHLYKAVTEYGYMRKGNDGESEQ